MSMEDKIQLNATIQLSEHQNYKFYTKPILHDINFNDVVS